MQTIGGRFVVDPSWGPYLGEISKVVRAVDLEKIVRSPAKAASWLTPYEIDRATFRQHTTLTIAELHITSGVRAVYQTSRDWSGYPVLADGHPAMP